MKNKSHKVALPILVGLLAVFAAYQWLWKTSPDDQELARTVKRSQQVFGLYLNADCERAREAIVDHIAQLDRADEESDRSARNPYAVDAMLWRVRLAKLDERNNRARTTEYVREACSTCQKLGWVDCSEQRLRSEIDRMDSIALAQLSVGDR